MLFEHLSWEELLEHPGIHQFIVHIKPTHALAKRSIAKLIEHPLLHYLPHHSYVISTTVEKAHKVQSFRGVSWIGYLEPHHKSVGHIELQNFNASHSALIVSLDANLGNSDLDAFFTEISENVSGDLRELSDDRFELWYLHFLHSFDSRETDFIWLSHHPRVSFIEPKRPATTQNKWARGVLQAGINLPDYDLKRGLLSWDHQLYGDGQVIGIGDTGIDLNSCFFDDTDASTPFVSHSPRIPSNGGAKPDLRKVIQYVTFGDDVDVSGHGTHVAGSAAGNSRQTSTPHESFNGMAPNAKIAFFDIGTASSSSVMAPGNLASQFFAWTYAAGARIHSNSWGSDADYYTSSDRDVDAFSWEHKDFVAVFAAGNNGKHGTRSILSPATSKNALSVGASINSPFMFYETFCGNGYEPQSSFCDFIRSPSKEYYNIEGIAGFSSMGPTFDGRRKPDIVAPGMFVYSADKTGEESCNEASSASLQAELGTSMAAPLVAGSLALVRQYFMEGFYPFGVKSAQNAFVPSGALLKAIAIAGAVEMKGYMDIIQPSGMVSGIYRSVGDAPNDIQGYGRLQLNKVLKFANYSNFNLLLAGWSSTRSYADDSLQASGDFKTYRICVIGEDEPHPSITLVWMDPPGSQASSIALVNDLDLTVQLANTSIFYYGNGQVDRKNNVEQVLLKNAQINQTFDITVSANNIGIGPQPYALVVTGKVGLSDADFECNFDDPFQEVDFIVIDKGETLPDMGGGEDMWAFHGELWFLIIAGTFASAVLAFVTIKGIRYCFVCDDPRNDGVRSVSLNEQNPGIARGSISYPMADGWRVFFTDQAECPVYVHQSGMVTDKNPMEG